MTTTTNFDYDLSTDRKHTERKLLECIIRFPNVAEKLPVHKMKIAQYKLIAEQVKALFKRDGEVNKDVLESFAIPRLVGKGTDEEVAASALNSLWAGSQKVESQRSFHSLIEHLNAVCAKDAAIGIATAITDRVNSGEEIRQICASGSQLIEISSSLKSAQKQVSLGDAFEDLMTDINMARTQNADLGVPYPIKSMSKHLGTMYPTDLVVVAARPAVGKTALALNLCRFTNEPMGFISSEMAKQQLAMRFIAMDAGIPANRIRDAKNLSDAELEKISEIHTQHKGRKLYIEDKGGIHIGEIEDVAESWVALHGIKVLVVDYAQRINSDRKHNSESEKIGHVTKRLKELAKSLGICVVLLAQINRDSVKGDRRPQVHDLKGSGDIEQEADTIVLMHKPSMGSAEQNERCVVEMIVDKNRHGPVGLLLTEYIANKVMFTDASEETRLKYKDVDI